MPIHPWVKRWLPDDTERLTFNPWAKRALNALALPGRLFYPEFARLPPNHLRCRVAAGARPPWRNEVIYIWRGYNLWLFFLGKGLANLDSDVLEIGCGCGRNAHALSHINVLNETFTGHYLGVDIDEEAIAWCQQNFPSEQFRFQRSPHRSNFYKNAGGEEDAVTIPLETESRDFVFSNAVFSHILFADAQNYLDEAARLLRRGGQLYVSFRCHDHLPVERRNRYTFYGDDGVYVLEPDRPEKDVAFGESLFRRMLLEAGFEEPSFNWSAPLGHSVTARKP